MIHILIISTSLADGGMQRQLSIFLQNFDREKLHITLALLENSIDYAIPDDVPVIHLKRTRRLQLSFYYRLLRVLSDRRYQVINSKISGLNELVMLFCGILRKNNLILEIRSTNKQPYYKKMGVLFKIFRADWNVVCNSRQAVREVKNYLPENTKVYYIGNGINADRFKRKQKLETTERRKRNLILGCVGRITPLKNLEVVIKSLYEFRDTEVRLIVVGAISDDAYYTRLRNMEEQLGVETKIEWAGKQQDIVNYYNMIDLFVMPSFYEGTPNALLEAMSCECICLISKSANTDNFLGEEFTFDEHNSRELTHKILIVKDMMREEQRQIGKNNRAFIIENYSIDNMVNKMTQLYYQIVEENSK